MTRRLTIHVGMPKCGSTSVARILALRATTLARAGVAVPRSGWSARGGHAGLAAELAGRRRATGHWRRLAAEIGASPAPRFVISCGALTEPQRRIECVERLRRLADDAALAVEVVGYVRPQWQWLESAYAQQVRTGSTAEPFARFAAAMLDAGTRLDYNIVFAPFRDAFPVRVFPLERACLAGGPATHFLGLLGGAAAPRWRAPVWANARPGAKETEIRRLARRSAGPRVARWSRALRGLPALFDADVPFAGFDAAEIRRLEARFHAANDRFARAYGIDAAGILFRQEAARPEPPGGVTWQGLGYAERRRVRRYVLDRTGVDLDPAAGPAGGRGRLWVRLAARGARVAAQRVLGRRERTVGT